MTPQIQNHYGGGVVKTPKQSGLGGRGGGGLIQAWFHIDRRWYTH